MRIGIFGSSMDPITQSHLISASEMLQAKQLDTVFFEPPYKERPDKTMKVYDKHRWNMLLLAIQGNEKFEASNFEMNQRPEISFTYYTMKHYKEQFPNDELFFLMGADLLPSLPHWRMGEELIAENRFIVINRKVKVKTFIQNIPYERAESIPMEEMVANNEILRKYQDHFHFVYKNVANETSSSMIREDFENGRDPRYYMPESVYHYILAHELYGYKKN